MYYYFIFTIDWIETSDAYVFSINCFFAANMVFKLCHIFSFFLFFFVSSVYRCCCFSRCLNDNHLFAFQTHKLFDDFNIQDQRSGKKTIIKFFSIGTDMSEQTLWILIRLLLYRLLPHFLSLVPLGTQKSIKS